MQTKRNCILKLLISLTYFILISSQCILAISFKDVLECQKHISKGESVCGIGFLFSGAMMQNDVYIYSRMCVIYALRVLACREIFDKFDEFCDFSASSVRESFSSFPETIIGVFGKEYLRHPTEAHLKTYLGLMQVMDSQVPSLDGTDTIGSEKFLLSWAGKLKVKKRSPK